MYLQFNSDHLPPLTSKVDMDLEFSLVTVNELFTTQPLLSRHPKSIQFMKNFSLIKMFQEMLKKVKNPHKLYNLYLIMHDTDTIFIN